MAFDRKIIELYFEKFSTTTVIRVFNFIRTSAFRVERLFWIAVLVGFTFTTTWSVTETIRKFLSEPTASLVYFANNASDLGGHPSNRGLKFPNAVLCFEINTESLRKLYEHKVDEVIEAESNISMKFRAELKKKLEKIHKSEDDRAKMLNSTITGFHSRKTADTDASVQRFHQLEQSNIDVFTEVEVAFLGLLMPMLVRLVNLEMDRFPMYADWQSISIERLYQAYVTAGVNFSELFALINEMLCVALQLRLVTANTNPNTFARQYTVYNLCRHAASSVAYFGVYYTGQEVMCYRLANGDGEYPINFNFNFDSFKLTMHTKPLYKETVGALRLLFIDLDGTLAREQQALSANVNDKQTIEFSLETVNTLVDLRRRRCSNRRKQRATYVICMVWCRLESIRSTCACEPISHAFTPGFSPPQDLLESCALRIGDQFSRLPAQCRLILSTDYGRQNCSVSCAPNCETSLFVSTIRSNDASLDFLNATTVLKLVSTKFVYQMVDEYVTMTFMQFITSLGGNLSLYLGASFLALIHIVVFFVKLPFEEALTINEVQNSEPLTHNYSVHEVGTAGKSYSSTDDFGKILRALVADVATIKQELKSLRQRARVEERQRNLSA